MMLFGYGIFLVFAGHISFYYVAMIVMTWGEVSNMLAESPYLTRRMPAQPQRACAWSDGSDKDWCNEWISDVDRSDL